VLPLVGDRRLVCGCSSRHGVCSVMLSLTITRSLSDHHERAVRYSKHTLSPRGRTQRTAGRVERSKPGESSGPSDIDTPAPPCFKPAGPYSRLCSTLNKRAKGGDWRSLAVNQAASSDINAWQYAWQSPRARLHHFPPFFGTAIEPVKLGYCYPRLCALCLPLTYL